MLIPQYWSEAKSTTNVAGRKHTIRRFGWSDTSEADAFSQAQARVQSAIQQIERGEQVRTRDHKVAYNGAEGLPIREEIVARNEDAIVTRNSYGSLCLNTPDVLFADVDFSIEAHPAVTRMLFIFIVLIGSIYFAQQGKWLLIIPTLIFSGLAAYLISEAIHKISILIRGGVNKICLTAIHEFSNANPDWNLRVYRTPMGYRILVLHRTFSARDEEAISFLTKLKSDPIYIQMCKNQNCFRARISPKPWRIEMPRLRPRPGVWPINADRLPEREVWVAQYSEKAKNFASCRFVEHLGSNTIHPKADYIRQIHDEYCRALTDLELA